MSSGVSTGVAPSCSKRFGPWLVVAVMGVLVLIGGYTGFRVSDLIRFRAFAQQTLGVGGR